MLWLIVKMKQGAKHLASLSLNAMVAEAIIFFGTQREVMMKAIELIFFSAHTILNF